jgi:hypothetical protein
MEVGQQPLYCGRRAMFTMLVMYLAAIDPLTPRFNPDDPRLLRFLGDGLLTQHLEWLRNRGPGLAEMIDWHDRMIQEPGFLSPGQVNDWRKMNAELRVTLHFMRKELEILEWWEEQRVLKPGLETDLAGLDRLDELRKEEKARRRAWDRGLMVPFPREVRYIAPRPRSVKFQEQLARGTLA